MADINAIIDEIVLKKFVSLEGAEAIANIRKLSEAQRVQIDVLTKDLAERKTQVADLEQANRMLAQNIEIMAKREGAVAEREKAVLKNELDAAHSKAMAELTERLFTVVFRNGVISRTLGGTIGGQVQMAGGNGGSYLSTIPVNRTETETLA